MTPEEKAKRYDEALKMAQSKIKNDKDHVLYEDDVIEIFPELKESEDEKIRKDLIQWIDEFPDTIWRGHYKKDILAWIEKQDIFSKKDVDDAYLKGVADTKNEMEKQYEANYQIRKDIATFIFNYRGDIKDRSKWMNYLGIKVSFVEKQDEQKPAWSEEDEKMVKDIIAAIDALYYHGMVKWLKSLKERIG